MKISIVIDNPDRDLEALSEVATGLAEKGFEVDLVPMYFAKVHLLTYRPDMVLLNYLRSSNSSLIRLCTELEIRICILDTEGAVWVDLAIYKDIVLASKTDKVQLYLTWGAEQKTYLESKCSHVSETFSVTGHPRFDRYIKSANLSSAGNTVLINTNFPAINPKYQGIFAEFVTSQNAGGLTETDARSFYRHSTITFGKFMEVVFQITDQNPSIQFVIRPHPFEDEECYKVFFAGCNNVSVETGGDVLFALQNACCLLHFDCTTAIEAALMGIPAISLEMCDFGQRRQFLAREVSTLVHEIGEVDNFIKDIQNTKINIESENKIKKLRPFFGPLDGKADERVVNEIAAEMQKINGASEKINIGFKRNLIRMIYLIFGTLPFYLNLYLRGRINARNLEKSLFIPNIKSKYLKVTALNNHMQKIVKYPLIYRIKIDK